LTRESAAVVLGQAEREQLVGTVSRAGQVAAELALAPPREREQSADDDATREEEEEEDGGWGTNGWVRCIAYMQIAIMTTSAMWWDTASA
jgi:hypothetical protein